MVEGPPIHIMDPDLQAIFRDVGGLPMGGQIGLKETKSVANLFALRAGVPIPGSEGLGAGLLTSSSGMSGDGGAGGGMKKSIFGGSLESTSTYKPPFKNVDVVYININASLFELKRRYVNVHRCIYFVILTP